MHPSISLSIITFGNFGRRKNHDCVFYQKCDYLEFCIIHITLRVYNQCANEEKLQFNENLRKGIPNPKNKTENWPKLLVALHVLEYAFPNFQTEPFTIPEEISVTSLEKSADLIRSIGEQKDLLVKVRSGSYLCPDTRLDCFLGGAKIYVKNLRVRKFGRTFDGGVKIFLHFPEFILTFWAL